MLRARQPLAQEASALGDRLRVRDDPLDVLELDRFGGDEAVVDRVHELGADADVDSLEHERVERHRDAALERVLDRDDGPIHGSLLYCHDGVVDRRIGDLVGVLGGGRAQGLTAVGPGGTEVGDLHDEEPGAASASAAATASCSSGESSCSELPSRSSLT